MDDICHGKMPTESSRANFLFGSGLETNFARPGRVQSPSKHVESERLERKNLSKRISRCYHIVVITRFIYIGSRGKAKGETINGLQVKRVKFDLAVSIR